MSDWIETLLAGMDVLPLTRANYANALRYWDAWHRLRYNAPLPLAEKPPRAREQEMVNAFLNEHAYVTENGLLRLTMPTRRFVALRESGFNGRRGVPSPRTTEFRMSVLNTAYEHAPLPEDEWRRDYWYRQLHGPIVRLSISDLYASWEAERVAVQGSETLPMSVTQIISSLVKACGSDREGLRDAALLVMLQRVTPQQAAALKFKDLTPGYISEAEQLVPVVEFLIEQPISAMQHADRRVRFLHNDADVVKAWGAIRQSEISGDDPFLVRWHGTRIAELSHQWTCRRVRLLAKRAGLADIEGRTTISPRWIRKGYEREFREQSMLVQIARAARVTVGGALQLSREVIKVGHRGRRRE